MPTPSPTTNPNTNRSVIVTGGASGLGKMMSRYFAEQGDLVTIFDVDAVNGEKVAAELDALQTQTQKETETGREGSSRGRVKFIRCDITSWEAQKDAFGSVYENLGRVDVVVANAGVSEGTRSWMLPPPGLKKGRNGKGQDSDENGVAGIKGDGEEKGKEDLEEEPRLRVLDVNLVGTVYCTCCSLNSFQRFLQLPCLTLFCTVFNSMSVFCARLNYSSAPFLFYTRISYRTFTRQHWLLLIQLPNSHPYSPLQYPFYT